MACVAIVNREPWMVALSAALTAAGLAAMDIARADRGGVSAITVYALSACITELANMVGLLSADASNRSMYFVYAIDDHLLLASWLSFCGTVLPVLGFWFIARDVGWNRVLTLLPSVSGRVASRHLLIGGTVLALLLVAVRWLNVVPNLGTVTALLLEIPVIMTFLLARMGGQTNNRKALWLSLLLASAESGRALLFDYLRGNVIAPFVALVLGVLLGSRSLRPLRTRFFVPIYAVGVTFVVFFGSFGVARGSAGGVDRLMRTVELQEIPEEYLEPAQQQQHQQGVLGRLTNFNQLSQIGRVVQEDGFYDGATLEYLGVAFIPRFLWPDKPAIAKGSWFALRIGQAYVRADGLSSNSVNMTVPGELYLNFGWLGAVCGCFIFGAIFAALWSRTGFWTDSGNTFGAAFGFFLLWFGIWLGVDLQVMVTLFAMYLTLVVAGAAYRSAFPPTHVRSGMRRGAAIANEA